MKLKDLGEFQLIERIRQRVSDGAGVHRGIGDDAAELSLPEGHHLLTSTDLLIEGVHFSFDWTSCADLGHKAVAVNLSDIAAMGGMPRFLYLGLACPGETEVAEINAFLDGALDEAERHGVTLVGGDTCRSPGPWLISVTIEGSAPAGRVVGRNGARPGDLIMVSGTLGDSALALHLLARGEEPEAALLTRHHRPEAQLKLGRWLGEKGFATAMIDTSDGLAGDLQHILKASQVGGLLEEDQLPLSPAFLRQAEGNHDLRELALYGGEDYQLLFTVAAEHALVVRAHCRAEQLAVTTIGVVQQAGGALALKRASGEIQALRAKGFDHFARLDVDPEET